MKYYDEETQTYKDISIKTLDTLPVGAVIDYDGNSVPVGWEATKDYSINEIQIGTWINGKPLYRKVLDCTNIGNTSVTRDTGLVSANTRVISFRGINNANNYYYLLPDFGGSGNFNGYMYLNASGTNIQLTINDARTISVYVIIEYIKTTD